MRRVMPPPRLRIHKGACAPVCHLALGRDGIALTPQAAPAGAVIADWPQIALAVASPYPTEGLSPTAGGGMVVSWTPGVIQSIVVTDLAQAFDRRPPGACEARGAAHANAALIRADDGWRAVVLPSIGDRISHLGPGPVAISASAKQIAVHEAGTTRVVPLAGGDPVAEYPGPVDAAAFAGERLWLSAGGAVGPAGGPALGTGTPVRALAGAGAADRVLALQADGSLVRYGADEAPRTWASVVDGVTGISLSDDGAWATLAGPDAVAVVRADDGAVGVYLAGVSAIALAGARRLVVGGTWGMALITCVEESG